MSNRRKATGRPLIRRRPKPELHRMTVRDPVTGADISERFGVPPELRGGPGPAPGWLRGFTAEVDARLVDEH